MRLCKEYDMMTSYYSVSYIASCLFMPVDIPILSLLTLPSMVKSFSFLAVLVNSDGYKFNKDSKQPFNDPGLYQS